MAKYSIQDTSLIAIGDAIRNKTGEHTRIEYGPYIKLVPAITVSKTPNATGFDSHEGSFSNQTLYDVVRISGASSIYVDIAVEVYLWTGSDNVEIVAGEYDASNFPTGTGETIYSKDQNNKLIRKQITVPNTDVITFKFTTGASHNYLGYYAECSGIDADGNPMGATYVEVVGEHEVKNTLTPAQMATEIEGLSVYEFPSEAFVLTGDCNHTFDYRWQWFLRDFGDKITTLEITNLQYMFGNYQGDVVPFDINISNKCSPITSVFARSNLKSVPYIKGDLLAPASNYTNNPSISEMFSNCYYLRYIPDDYFDQFGGDEFWAVQATYEANRSGMFNSCYSLRKLPKSWKKLMNNNITSYGSIYSSFLSYCSSLDEATDIPINSSKELTSNMFSNLFAHIYRVKNITFELNDDGTPKTAKWKGQALDLSSYVGYPSMDTKILNYNSGITKDKAVSDDKSYQALKDDPDWYAYGIGDVAQKYSRYNHDSAVATINSLPDTSAYLAEKGGTNTIKFRGISGSLTDGGAINTLTEEEIAVAAAKGWTVTFI